MKTKTYAHKIMCRFDGESIIIERMEVATPSLYVQYKIGYCFFNKFKF